MIFYFSATGNSLHVAKQLAVLDERLVSIPEALDRQACEYHVGPGESVGIVSPTYNWTMPSVVSEFLEKLQLTYDVKPYVYYVGTFGTTTGAAATMANRIMRRKGLPFDAMFDVKMPDTWTPMFDLSDKERVVDMNRRADTEIEQVKAAIEAKFLGRQMHITTPYPTGVIGKWIYDNKTRRTSNLSVEPSCIGCGLCAKKCPVHAMEMRNGRPVWVKGRCTMCLGCLHRCPKFAIQCGPNTKHHGQYRHP